MGNFIKREKKRTVVDNFDPHAGKTVFSLVGIRSTGKTTFFRSATHSFSQKAGIASEAAQFKQYAIPRIYQDCFSLLIYRYCDQQQQQDDNDGEKQRVPRKLRKRLAALRDAVEKFSYPDSKFGTEQTITDLLEEFRSIWDRFGEHILADAAQPRDLLKQQTEYGPVFAYWPSHDIDRKIYWLKSLPRISGNWENYEPTQQDISMHYTPTHDLWASDVVLTDADNGAPEESVFFDLGSRSGAMHRIHKLRFVQWDAVIFFVALDFFALPTVEYSSPEEQNARYGWNRAEMQVEFLDKASYTMTRELTQQAAEAEQRQVFVVLSRPDLLAALVESGEYRRSKYFSKECFTSADDSIEFAIRHVKGLVAEQLNAHLPAALQLDPDATGDQNRFFILDCRDESKVQNTISQILRATIAVVSPKPNPTPNVAAPEPEPEPEPEPDQNATMAAKS